MFKPGDRVRHVQPFKGKPMRGTIMYMVPESSYYYVRVNYQVWSIPYWSLVADEAMEKKVSRIKQRSRDKKQLKAKRDQGSIKSG
jgi:hypothetical protein